MPIMQPALHALFAIILPLIGPRPADMPLTLLPGDRIVAIGDSITQDGGYIRDVDDVLAAQYPDGKIPKVINKGISGQQAEDMVKRFDADVVKLKPAYVTISAGINEVLHRLDKPDDSKVLEAYKKNVAAMVDQAQAAGIVVVLLSPTVIEEDAASDGNRRLERYVEAERKIAAEKKCRFVDLHAMFLTVLKHKPSSETGKWLTRDGVHMKPLGDAVMAAGVLRGLGVPDKKIARGEEVARGNPTKLGLVPEPESVEVNEGSFTLDAETKIVPDKDSVATALQLSAYLKPAMGWDLEVSHARLLDLYHKKTIDLSQDRQVPGLGSDGYKLRISQKAIYIWAYTQTGLFYGIQTLRQLLPPQTYCAKKVDGVEWKVPCVTIWDYPRFPWRGLMLDSGHDFQELPFVFKYIDWMAAHKFNVFHWHLTDLGTWSIEIKKYPKLTDASTRGKGVKPGFYTQEQIREVVKYAAERHITIVPEIDMPGHSVPALLAYPELNCPLKGGRVWQYCIGNEKTFEFLEDVLTEVCDLFPGKYIHIGGDECPKDRWHQCPLCQARMKAEGLKDERELQSYFVKRIEKFLDGKGKRLIGWDEILEGGLAPGAAVMSWRGMGGGIAAAQAGHDVVMAPTSHVYFDYPKTTVEKVFSFEPMPKELTKEQAAHVLGAEAEMWTDTHPSEKEIEALVYPRASALAEVLWSPAAGHSEAEFMERLTLHEKRLEIMGVRYQSGERK